MNIKIILKIVKILRINNSKFLKRLLMKLVKIQIKIIKTLIKYCQTFKINLNILVNNYRKVMKTNKKY